jgi:hypothetical protein
VVDLTGDNHVGQEDLTRLQRIRAFLDLKIHPDEIRRANVTKDHTYSLWTGRSRAQVEGKLETLEIGPSMLEGKVDAVTGEIILEEKHLQSLSPRGTTVELAGRLYSMREDRPGIFRVWDGSAETVTGEDGITMVAGLPYRVSQNPYTGEFSLVRADFERSMAAFMRRTITKKQAPTCLSRPTRRPRATPISAKCA